MSQEINKNVEAPDLVKLESKLYDLLAVTGKDTAIAYLFQEMFQERAQHRDSRHMQQRVGAVVSRVNAKIKDKKLGIVPGELKRTYKLIELK